MSEYFLSTRLGTIQVSWNSNGLLKSLVWAKETKTGNHFDPIVVHPFWKRFLQQLENYFAEGCPLNMIPWNQIECEAWSVFQKKVYEVSTFIPFGETRSYAWVAQKIGQPLSSRAVGQALKKNPLPVLIPCHRVVASQGGLGGFMGKSNPTDPEMLLKSSLLELERSYQNPLLPIFNNLGQSDLDMWGGAAAFTG